MSKKKHYNNRGGNRGGGYAGKSNHTGAKVIAAIALLLAVAYVITSLALGMQWNPLKWVKGDDVTGGQTEPNKTEIVAVSSDGKKLLSANSYAMPRAMSFVQNQSMYSKSKEFTVTATLSNQYINGKFDWSVSFVNPASAWATGKVAEYHVQATPTSDGSATAKIKYIASFSEPITVTATLRGSDKSDSCRIDCLKQMDMVNCWLDTADFGDRIEGGCELESTADGTVKADYQVYYANFELNNDFIEAVKNYLKFDIEIHSFSFASEIGELSIEEETDNRLQLGFYGLERVVKYSDFIENFDAFDQEHKDAVYYAWYHAMIDNNGGVQFEFGVKGYVYEVETVLTSGTEDGGGFISYLLGERYGKDIQPNVTLNQNVIF